MSLVAKLKGIMEKGHERTVRARKNVLMAVIYKGLGVLIGFAVFPLSLEYLDPVRFGIFLTLASTIDWFSDLDVGISNGMRNRFAESVAEGRIDQARAYVSTAYFIIGSIAAGLALTFMTVCMYLPWADWVKADPSMNREIAFLAMVVFIAFAIRFVSDLIYQIFNALQRTAEVDKFKFITKAGFLLMILVLIFFTEDSLLYFGAAKSFTFALVPLIVGLFYFRGEFKKYAPSLKLVKAEYMRGLLTLGVKFFIIKICFVIIHSTNNVLIINFVEDGPRFVSRYEAAYKYLSVLLMFFMIMTNQLWAAYVEAYTKGDIDWIKKIIKDMVKIWAGTVGIAAIMVIVSGVAYQLWLGDRLDVSMKLTMFVAASVCITNWVNMYNLVLNGSSKVQLQMYIWIFASILNIPLSIFFATNMGMGAEGIVLGTIVSLIPNAILAPIQVKKILNKTDLGLWGR